MDPSYNNSFGSFGAGGSGVPGGAGMPGASGATGAVGGSAPITSGTGDIVLQPTQKKRSRKWIVVVALILVFAIAGVVTWLVLGGVKGGDGTESVSVNNLQEAVNSYANYVFYGKNSVETIDFNSVTELRPYFESENLPDDYFVIERQKFAILNELYYSDYDALDFDSLSTYFYDYPKFQAETIDKINNAISTNGAENVRSEIDSFFVVPGGINGNMVKYIDDMRVYTKAYVEYLVELEKPGCLIGEEISVDCRQNVDNVVVKVTELQAKVLTDANNIRSNAMRVMNKLIEEEYDS